MTNCCVHRHLMIRSPDYENKNMMHVVRERLYMTDLLQNQLHLNPEAEIDQQQKARLLLFSYDPDQLVLADLI